MARLNLVSRVLAHPRAYLLWQAPFAARKLRPLLEGGDVQAARRVLDVGCGPGTNAALFRSARYTGVDLSREYVAFARRHHPDRDFEIGDALAFEPRSGERFDLILVNSLLHHLDDAAAARLLAKLGDLLVEDGHVHVLDLVLPERRGAARALARLDRGRHARPLADWKRLLFERFEPRQFRPYPLGALGLTLWQMIYFKGGKRA